MSLDDWVIKRGDDIYLVTERGLEAARVMALCRSREALGLERLTLGRSRVLFRDPANTVFAAVRQEGCRAARPCAGSAA